MGKHHHDDSSSSSESEDDKKKKKKHKHKKSKHSSSSSRSLPPGVAPISEDDYFSRNVEFATWLNRKRGVIFDTLTTKEAKRLFGKFIRRWNEGSLSNRYYDGEFSSNEANRTGYKWKFAGKLEKSDKQTLSAIHNDVNSLSSRDDLIKGPYYDPKKSSSARDAAGRDGGKRRRQGPEAPNAYELEEYARKVKQKDKRDFRKHHKMVEEELVPKATGHEAKVEKKRARAQASRAREDSPDRVVGVDVMGTNSSFQTELARRKAYREKKERERTDVKREKLAAHQEKERGKLAALMELARNSKREGALWQG